MKNEQVSEVQERRSVWIKLAIGLLIVISVGQISAIFIPAMVGQSPNPLSLFGSILWPGLLFMSIWSFKGKTKIVGFCLGALVGLLLHFSAAVTAGYHQAEERAIDEAVAAANEKLPKMIDEETRLDSVSIDQETKSYSLNMSLVNLAISEIDVDYINERFESSIKPASCNNDSFKIFFNENYKINYVYKDKSGKLVAKYSVNPSYCQ